MKRDSIYYQIFKRFPGLLFELIDYHPEQAQNYRFESVEVKETAFRIDGVFLPPEGAMPRIIFFVEVQFQKDEALYHRFFTEVMMYLNRNQSQYDDWYCVVIFPSRSLEPSDTKTHRVFREQQPSAANLSGRVGCSSPAISGYQLNAVDNHIGASDGRASSSID